LPNNQVNKGKNRQIRTTPERSRLMSRVRQNGTKPELAVQEILRSLNYAFDTDAKDLPGTPDIVNRTNKWAIYVHGCFWHAHTCPLWKIPQTNPQFWREKFIANKDRDKRKLKQLKNRGYSVLTLWQCQLKNNKEATARVVKFMQKVKHNSSSNGSGILVRESQINNGLIDQSAYEHNVRKGRVIRRVSKKRGGQSVTSIDTLGIKKCKDAHSLFDQAFLRGAKVRQHGLVHGTVRAVDLFSGCGGLSLGAREASVALGFKFESLVAIDQDEASLNTYVDNFHPRFIWNSDISEILTGEIDARLQPEEQRLLTGVDSIDLLLAGPPCQGHSDLNNHTRRKDKRNKLYDRVARFAQIAGPQHILIENVPAVIHGRGRVVDRAIEQLQRLGYNVDVGIINLADLGVPQRRKRHVLIASHSRCLSVSEVLDRHGVPTYRDTKWAIGDLKTNTDNGIFDSPAQLQRANVLRVDYLFRKGIYDLPNRLRPVCHQRDHSYKSMYGRLKYYEPAQTITSGFGSPGQGRFIHPVRPTTLTPHEAARLQFFPDSFGFSSARLRTSIANMIGNAVPMKLSYAVSLELIR
jgi:DNA (cytosine-5)-methyltransferase 1